jgi:hypothetical protein
VKKTAFILLIVLLISSGIFIQFSCKKGSDISALPDHLRVELPGLSHMGEDIPDVPITSEGILLQFNEAVDPSTTGGNIVLMLNGVDISSSLSLQHSEDRIRVRLARGISLPADAECELRLLEGLRSISGLRPKSEQSISILPSADQASGLAPGIK